MSAYLPPQPIVWARPDTRPFSGTPAAAMRLLIRAGFPERVVRAQFAAYAAGQCRVRPLHPGEHFDAMLFGHDDVERDVIAATDRWPPVASRAAVECGVTHDGERYALLRPMACGNWSEESMAFSPPWGVPFAPPVGPMPGFAETIGGNEESAYGGFGAFAGGWAAGAGAVGYSPALAVREVSFVLPAPAARTEYRERHWFRRRWHRAAFRFPVPSVPPIVGAIPSPARVPEPSSGALLLTALLGMAAITRFWRRVP